MKRVLFIALLSVVAVSCKKDKEPAPVTPTTNNNNNNTNSAAGNWTVTIYDGAPVTAPAAATLNMTATSTTEGTAHFDITFDGTNHNTEDDTYVLSNNNGNIVFTKTGGGYNVLGGGGTWTVNTLTANSLKMTSSFGLIVECKK